MWEVLKGRVLKVSTFSSQHASGELPIPSPMREPQSSSVPDVNIGVVGSDKAKSVMGTAKSALSYASSEARMRVCEVREGWKTEACDDELGVFLVEL